MTMEGPQYRPKMPRNADMEELLSHGYFKNSRIASTNIVPTIILSNRNCNAARRTTTSRNYRKPVCEDELQSLAKEVDSGRTAAASLLDYEPPARGSIDQHPVLLEADISQSDALKYEKQSREEEAWEQTKKASSQAGNQERRWVHIPSNGSFAPGVEGQSEAGLGTKNEPLAREGRAERRTSRERKGSRERDEVRQKTYNTGTQRPGNLRTHTLDVDPVLIRREGSGQDLPTLKTKAQEKAPPFHRTVSDFAFSSQSPERRREKAAHAQNGEYLLCPESASSGRSVPRNYQDGIPRQFPRPEDQATTRQTLPEKRAGDVHLLTPKSATSPREKSGDDRSSARRYSNQKMAKPQLDPEEKRRYSHRDSSPLPKKYQYSEPAERSRPSSSSFDDKYFVESCDESLTDDEPVVQRQRDRDDYRVYHRDYDRHYDGEHNHRHHHRRRSHNPKYLEADHDHDNRHQHSSSKINPTVKSGSRVASALPSPSPTQVSFDQDILKLPRDSKKDPINPLNIVTILATDLSTSHSPQAKASSRRSSPGSESLRSPRSSPNTLQIPIPGRGSLRDSTESLSSPIFDEPNRKTPVTRSPVRTPHHYEGHPFWQPAEDRSGSAGAHRCHAKAIDQSSIGDLPDCPRKIPVVGEKDWLTLPGCPSFDICPTCFKEMSKTRFAHRFVASPRRRTNEPVACTFGTLPWYRLAWLTIKKEGIKDLRLFEDIANINRSTPKCLGPHEVARDWHSLSDPTTKKPIDGFNVCPSCVLSIETILPSLKGIFVPKAPHPITDPYTGSKTLISKTPPLKIRTCDMRFDSSRFIKYFEMLRRTAADTADTADPDTTDLVALTRLYASVDECPGEDRMVRNGKWHYITQLPGFTVCEECFEVVVRPLRREGWAVAKMFGRESRRVEGGAQRCWLAAGEEGTAAAERFVRDVKGSWGDFAEFKERLREW